MSTAERSEASKYGSLLEETINNIIRKIVDEGFLHKIIFEMSEKEYLEILRMHNSIEHEYGVIGLQYKEMEPKRI